MYIKKCIILLFRLLDVILLKISKKFSLLSNLRIFLDNKFIKALLSSKLLYVSH